MADATTYARSERRTPPACPFCGPRGDVYRLRDKLNRVIRTTPRVYACDTCCSTFAHRAPARKGGRRRG